MLIEIERTFDAAPDDVHGALIDPVLQTAKAEALSALAHSMTTETVDGRLVVVTRRRVATGGMPEFVKALVKPSMTVVETERWDEPQADRSRDAEFLLDIEGAPVRLRGSARLHSVETGTRLAWRGELEATVPLFRNRITEAASASVIETITIEFDLLERRLAGGEASARQNLHAP
ncbi:DUF2505 domain-containing protein [Aeromicrobium sp. CF3.5]|uniref:DUF2505 domain-containing protein n=1 Tax=Aeromicrobium sp. CF3.5 TaxID=3373078 RepID=UPI003EE6A002